MSWATAAGMRKDSPTAPDAMPPRTTSALSEPSRRTTRRLSFARCQPAAMRPTRPTVAARSAVVRLAERGEVVRRVDVARRAEIVARDEPGGDDAQPVVRDGVPRRAGDEQRVAADVAVRGGDDLAALRPPALDHACDRAGRERGPVGEDDDRRFDVLAEGAEPAAQRRTRPALPLRAPDEAGLAL